MYSAFETDDAYYHVREYCPSNLHIERHDADTQLSEEEICNVVSNFLHDFHSINN